MDPYADIPSLLYAASCLTLIIATLICAAFRWWHVCGQCAHDPDYYYPARRSVCAFFLWNLLYVPVLLRPTAPSVTAYASCVELVMLSTVLPTVFIKYFKPEHIGAWRRSSFNYVLPLSLTAMMGVYVSLVPDGPPYVLWGFRVFIGLTALLGCISFASVQRWLDHKIDRFHLDEYSNSDDFPYQFAKRVAVAPWLALGLCWLVFFTESRMLMALIWTVMAVLGVYYTIVILHPQRKLAEALGEEGTMDEGFPALGGSRVSMQDSWQPGLLPRAGKPSPLEGGGTPPLPRYEALREQVIAVCRRRYLEPHLTRREIISEFDYGSRTLAGKIISEYGFYTMINSMRLEHARRYAAAHPLETKESVAVNSGFKDRFAMRHAERKIGTNVFNIF